MLRSPQIVNQLFLLNICLQLFDGVATYQGIVSPAGEGNPLVAAVMANLGIGSALVIFKAKACGCLVLIRRIAGEPLASTAFVSVAVVYGALSFIPWLLRLLTTAM